MRILVFEDKPTLLRGGQERSLREVVLGLRRRGVTFYLAYRERGELSDEYEDVCEKTFCVRNRIVSHKRPDRFLLDVYRLLFYYYTKQLQPNLIYANQFYDLPLAALLGKMLRIPVVCHLRLPPPPYLSRQFRWSLSNCAALIANSRYTATAFQDIRRTGASLEVVHNCVDTDFFKPFALPTGGLSRSRVLYLGRLSPEKGIEYLIQAMPAVARRVPGAHLWIVGNEQSTGKEYSSELRHLAETRAAGLVHFRAAVADVRPIFHEVDLLVLPSVWEEPFGRVLIEAMACGVPCIATAVGGVPEILSPVRPESLVPPKNEDAMIKAICTTLKWREHNPMLGTQCRQYVIDNFNQSKMFDRILSIFEITAAKKITFTGTHVGRHAA